MDFYRIVEKEQKDGTIEIYPDFRVCRSKDLMVRGKAFYAIWDEQKGLWSTDEYDVQRLVDEDLEKYYNDLKQRFYGKIKVRWMRNFSSSSWANYKKYVNHLADCYHVLDSRLTFSNAEISKEDYISKVLPYPLKKGDYRAYDELTGVLYEPDERAKLEWAIGAIISGDARDIQKFIVLYGEAGTGKSTILNIIQKLFEGYYTTFEAKSLTSSSNAFSTEVFRCNPLVAIQHDGDLSRIEDNTKLNSIVSHEEMTMNEKYKSSYTSRINCFLFMGTNRPVKITDAKSGIIRRLIDVQPSGNKIPPKKYQALMSQIDFELGAIAYHCLEVYQEMGKHYYASYRPLNMIFQTDVFFNFVEANYYVFRDQDGTTLSQAYTMYKTYCDEALVDFKYPRHKFREELKSYFQTFSDLARVDGKQIRSYYSGFLKEKFSLQDPEKEEHQNRLVLDSTESIFDKDCSDCIAQYANSDEKPLKEWDKVKTTLSTLDTTKLHYVRIPENHIVIDFDLKNEKGEKDLEKNLEAASKWPVTYAEFSKGGSGIHLHYIYDGDISLLSRVYAPDIEIKVFTGKSSLRRKLSKCNNMPIAHISSGLPMKGGTMIDFKNVANEKALRTLIKNNLEKKYHNGTKPSIDFIHKSLEDAYTSGIAYDVSDLIPKILVFAANSTHNSDYCVKLVNQMKFKSEEGPSAIEKYDTDTLVFFDVEVFPNLFLICWKYQGDERECVKMFNPTPEEIEPLLNMKLVGFNCRRYDNHIVYAAYSGYTNKELFQLSQKIISGNDHCFFSSAYGLSYTDVYDFSSKKQSLKKWEIELGIHHQELGFSFDEPIPEDKWDLVAEYCCNDVIATEAVFNCRQGDFAARKILAALSGLTVNDTTNSHSARIIFGKNKNPQDQFVYTDLSEMFPGYKFENGVSTYRGEVTGEGGYVYSEPGMYSNVALLDVASMHPTSIEQLNLFGPYTVNFSGIKSGRLHIKHEEIEKLENLLNGLLLPFAVRAIDDPNCEYNLEDLAYALKIVINAIYGLTSASFPNPFKDPRNKDNIVAKRGALFMIDLKHAVQEKGYKVVHIKTDSIKIPDATPEIIQFVIDFGKKYGYDFEHEATYEKMCLVNKAVYIAKKDGKWTATGEQFAQPYVFKTLFSKESIDFEDMCETMSVSTALYLDMNEKLEEGEHEYHFVGKVGQFCPMVAGSGGGLLMRKNNEGGYGYATGAKGYRWMESEMVKNLGKENDIDIGYYAKLVDQAVEDISKFGDFEWFVSNDSFPMNEPDDLALPFN